VFGKGAGAEAEGYRVFARVAALRNFVEGAATLGCTEK
jgi:hypothetical protein